MIRIVRVVTCALFIFSATFACGDVVPQNIILFIGDGMGPEQVEAGGMWAYGSAGTLSFESFAYQGLMTTYSANSSVTDSAAAATAMATGVKVDNGVISMASPGSGGDLETLLEMYQDDGKSTGLVTSTYVSHATPAAFGAHETSRNNYSSIANDLLTDSKPNVLMGGAKYVSSSAATAAGYTVVTTRDEMLAIDTGTTSMLSGQFGSDYMPYEMDYDYDSGSSSTLPHLSAMTSTALDVLDNDPDGFFLMVEGGRIDHSGHDNRIDRLVEETAEFSNAVQEAIDWAAGRTDTLIIVTADHETGGLQVLDHSGSAGDLPSVSWSTGGHTGTDVPIYAWGVNADLVGGVMDNTDVFTIAATGTTLDPEAVPALTTTPIHGATLDFGLVRIGATGSELLTAANTGEDGSELVGNFPAASGEFGPGNTALFGPVAFGNDTSRQYTYDPVNRGLDTLPVTVTSNGGDSTITLSGTGVGPLFDSSLAPGSLLNFDTVEPGIPESLFLDLSNITTDANGGDNTLTDLTLLGVEITGENADLFDVIGFTPGTLLHKDDIFNLEFGYDGTGTSGIKSATLTIHTDEDADLGVYGSDFSYDIFANVLGDTSGSGLVEADGSLLITLDSVNFYKVFIGDELGEETFDFTDLLHYDDGNTAPNWICWAASQQDHVDGTVQGDENFAEIISSGNWIGTPTFPATDFDTGINVDPLPEGYKLWLKYGFLGQEPTLMPIDAPNIPEPSTLALLGMGAIGLLAGAWRRRRR